MPNFDLHLFFFAQNVDIMVKEAKILLSLLFSTQKSMSSASSTKISTFSSKNYQKKPLKIIIRAMKRNFADRPTFDLRMRSKKYTCFNWQPDIEEKSMCYILFHPIKFRLAAGLS